MATVSKIHGPISPNSNCFRTKWANLTSANPDGEALSLPHTTDRSVHIAGTLSTATVILQGSNEVTPPPWEPLHDAAGDAISVTSTGIHMIAENVMHIRPLLSGADGSTSVDVILLSKAT